MTDSQDPTLSLVAIVVDETMNPLTLHELSRACHVPAPDIEAWVGDGIVEPCAGQTPGDWRFGAASLRRALAATRLLRDLEVAEGDLALMLDLLDEIEHLQAKLRRA